MGRWQNTEQKSMNWVEMSIRYQMTLMLVALSTFFVGTTWALQHYVMLPAFASIERESAVQDVRRCLEAIEAEVRAISMLTRDYAAWDDTCVFVTDRNDAYRQSNLTHAFHQTTGNDFFAIVNQQSEVIATSCIAPESGQPRAIPELLSVIQAEGSPFTDFSSKEQLLEGVVSTSFGPLLVAAPSDSDIEAGRPHTRLRDHGPISECEGYG